MSRRYKGGVISATAPVPTGPYQCGTAKGIWTLPQELQATAAGIWPIAGNIQDGTFAIFARGAGTSTTNKYTYSGDVSAAATSLLASGCNGAAAGSSSILCDSG